MCSSLRGVIACRPPQMTEQGNMHVCSTRCIRTFEDMEQNLPSSLRKEGSANETLIFTLQNSFHTSDLHMCKT